MARPGSKSEGLTLHWYSVTVPSVLVSTLFSLPLVLRFLFTALFLPTNLFLSRDIPTYFYRLLPPDPLKPLIERAQSELGLLPMETFFTLLAFVFPLPNYGLSLGELPPPCIEFLFQSSG